MANEPKFIYPYLPAPTPTNPMPTVPPVIPVSDRRVFIALGKVKVEAGFYPAGINCYVVDTHDNTAVKSTGKLISWHRSGRNEDLFFWAVLFELGDIIAFPNGTYDLLVSAYKSSGNSTASVAEDQSTTVLKSVPIGVALDAALAGEVAIPDNFLALTVTYPTPGVKGLNSKQFMAYGAYDNNTPPLRAILTDNINDVSFASSTLFVSPNVTGAPAGYWYVAFPKIPQGNYSLDIGYLNTSKTVENLNFS